MKRIVSALAVLTLALVAGCDGEKPETPPADTTSQATPAPPPSAPQPASATAGPAPVAEKDLKTTPTGLKYAILKEGKGAEAGHHSVSVHYTGWLENGEKFDSSVDKGTPFEFELGHGGVIPGWDEGVKGMKVGEKRRLVVPPALGYGPAGTPGGPIPPNSTLIFDVELLGLKEGHAH